MREKTMTEKTMNYKEINEHITKYFKLPSFANSVLIYKRHPDGPCYKLNKTNRRHNNVFYLAEVERVADTKPTEYYLTENQYKGYYVFDANLHDFKVDYEDDSKHIIIKSDCTYVEYVEPLTLPFDDDQLKNVDIWDQVEDILQDEKTVPDNLMNITNFRTQSCLRNMQALASLSNQYTPKQMARLAVQMADELVSKVYGKQ